MNRDFVSLCVMLIHHSARVLYFITTSGQPDKRRQHPVEHYRDQSAPIPVFNLRYPGGHKVAQRHHRPVNVGGSLLQEEKSVPGSNG